MASPTTIATVKATVPVLAQHGLAIVKHFYQHMLAKHPELKNIFNLRHQQSGEQPHALTHAVYAYAANIDKLDVLLPAVMRIAHKHASLNVQPDQYDIVGENLLGAIKAVLGEAATPAIIDAWAEAYGDLAKLLIDTEAKLYDEAAAKPGGWRGWRDFVVAHRRDDSEVITTFYLTPKDGHPVAGYKPGQYISLVVDVPELGVQQIRQYSLSDSPNGRSYRITVKREDHATLPDGSADTLPHVSELLHKTLKKGDVVRITPPFGDFHIDTEAKTPVVLISGGVGQTALVAMLKWLLRESQREVVFVHAARHGGVHAMKNQVRAVAETNQRMRSIVFYENPRPQDDQGYDYDYAGRIDMPALRPFILLPGADYYVCGPVPFIQEQVQALKDIGAKAPKIHYEVFGVDAGNVE